MMNFGMIYLNVCMKLNKYKQLILLIINKIDSLNKKKNIIIII
jgi:hypothetical protein